MVKTRRANKEDIDKIHQLEKKYFEKPWSRDLIERDMDLDISNYYVIEEDSRVLAYINFWLLEGLGELNRIIVEEDFRKKNYGRILMEELFSEDLVSVILEVRENNTGAIEFYKKLGFKQIDKRDNYYGNRMHALVMEKRF